MQHFQLLFETLVDSIFGKFLLDAFFSLMYNATGELVKKDLPASQRAVLSDNVYARGHRIVRDIDELNYLGVKYGQEARVMGKPMVGFQ